MTGLRVTLTVATIFLLTTATSTTLSYAQTGGASSANAAAPGSEAGVRIGLGGLSNIEDSPGRREVIGVEGCLRCGRRALFVEYSHWTKPDASYATAYRSSDTVMAGLRLQGRQRIRPFFDAGVAFANMRFGRRDYRAGGFVLGTGATVDVRERLYLRFGGRIILLSALQAGADVGASVGWRF